MRELPDRLRGDELLVLNDTRVVPARLHGRKETGGRVELLCLGRARERPERLVALGRASNPLRAGTRIHLDGADAVALRVEARRDDGRLELTAPSAPDELEVFLERHGELPLPPYVEREAGPTAEDRERYQTVFAARPGSVAAPTAGLHLTEGLLAALRARGCEVATVTLHVGPGTFEPVRTAQLEAHRLHRERYEVPAEAAEAVRRARADGRPVLAVGTTVVRTLEAVAAAHGEVVADAGETELFIRPGWRFRVVDAMLTNFHLPRSSLLMLVCAFAGRQRVLDAYAEAVRRGYRFYSYGDGMLIR